MVKKTKLFTINRLGNFSVIHYQSQQLQCMFCKNNIDNYLPRQNQWLVSHNNQRTGLNPTGVLVWGYSLVLGSKELDMNDFFYFSTLYNINNNNNNNNNNKMIIIIKLLSLLLLLFPRDQEILSWCPVGDSLISWV